MDNNVVNKPNYIYIWIILLVLLIIIGILFWQVSVLRSNFKLCENSESSYCPQMYCDKTHVKCGNYPYRTDRLGKTVCATYLITKNAPIGKTDASGIGGN